MNTSRVNFRCTALVNLKSVRRSQLDRPKLVPSRSSCHLRTKSHTYSLGSFASLARHVESLQKLELEVCQCIAEKREKETVVQHRIERPRTHVNTNRTYRSFFSELSYLLRYHPDVTYPILAPRKIQEFISQTDQMNAISGTLNFRLQCVYLRWNYFLQLTHYVR